jgi:hypothetical protein
MENNGQTPTIHSVITSCSHISVEDYQRTYQWEKANIEEFFEDLKETVGSGERHFFGTLILQQTDDPNGTSFAVVDGQQRLTTIFILVAALRDAIKKLDHHSIPPATLGGREVRVLDKAQNFLYTDPSSVDVHRFTSNRILRDLMKNCVISEPETQAEVPARDKNTTLAFRKAVRSIRELVRKDLEKVNGDDGKLARVNQLLDTLFEKFVVLRIATSSVAESLEIFLTLNNRGLALGPSDIVRGHVMKNLGHDLTDRDQETLQQRVLNEWETVAENVGDPESFMRHYLLTEMEGKVQKKKVVSIVTTLISREDPIERKQATQAFWSDLIDASETYSKLITPNMGGDCAYQIELLNGLMKSHRILLLAVFRSSMDTATRNEIVRLTWVMCFRWVMAGMNAQILENFFQELCTSIREKSPAAIVQRSLEEKIDTINLDPEEYLIAEGDSAFASRALLHATNRAITRGANPVAFDSTLHLEHIAPNSGNDDWAQVLGLSDPNSSEYNNTVGAIGNLTLLDVKLTLQAQRKLFSDKAQDHYHLSTMDITRDLCSLNGWSAEIIAERTKWLSECFEILWSKQQATREVERFSDWLESE